MDDLFHLDFSTLDIAAAHRRLGEDVSAQVHAILQKRFDRLNPAELAAHVCTARQCRAAIDSRLHSPDLDFSTRSALGQYLLCLSAWAEGAGLDHFAAGSRNRVPLGSDPLSAEDLALWLQSEQGGCQTGIYRDEDGSIILWHTEEDVESNPGSRFDKLRLFSYRVPTSGRVITSFIYPDLLPGPTFGWSSDLFVQAVDSLFVREQKDPRAILPNVLAWLRLFLGREVGTERIVEAMAPFSGAYALTTVHRDGRGWQGHKVEFAGNQFLSAALSDRPGDFLFQVNVFSDAGSRVARQNEDIDARRRGLFERRVARTERSIAALNRSGDRAACFRRLLASRAGGDFAYSNPDVKATFLCKAAAQNTQIWIGVGPASRKDGLLPLQGNPLRRGA